MLKKGLIFIGLAVIGILLFISFNSCEVDAVTPQAAGLIWEYPNDHDQGVVGFIIYSWNGTSPGAFNQADMDSVGYLAYDFAAGDTLFEFRPFMVTAAYVVGGVVAIDGDGIRSEEMGLSEVTSYWSIYGLLPANVIGIIK